MIRANVVLSDSVWPVAATPGLPLGVASVSFFWQMHHLGADFGLRCTQVSSQ